MDLRNVRRKKLKVENIRELIDTLNSSKEYGERILHNTPGSNYPTEKLSKIVCRIEELTEQLLDATLDYDVEVMLSEKAIDSLPESEQKIARARYVEGLSWSEVAKKTHFSKGHCWNANTDIVKKVEGMK